jgi:hypothetical protein
MAEKPLGTWTFITHPKGQQKLLESTDLHGLTLDILSFASDRSPTEIIPYAGYDLLMIGQRERAKAVYQAFINILGADSVETLKQGAEFILYRLQEQRLATEEQIQAYIEFCKELGMEVNLPDINKPVVIFY